MAGRLLAFAKTNVPNIEGSIDWKESDINNVHTMVFAEKCEVKTNFDEKLLNLMEGLKVFGRA
jgi:carboxylesterase type B